jgi:hypothetical protein
MFYNSSMALDASELVLFVRLGLSKSPKRL